MTTENPNTQGGEGRDFDAIAAGLVAAGCKVQCPFCTKRVMSENWRPFSGSGIGQHIRDMHPEHAGEVESASRRFERAEKLRKEAEAREDRERPLRVHSVSGKFLSEVQEQFRSLIDMMEPYYAQGNCADEAQELIGRIEGMHDEAARALAPAPASSVPDSAAVELEREEKAHEATIAQRDRAEAFADRLSHLIGQMTGEEIGEHSNLSCPWTNAERAALDALSSDSTPSPALVEAFVAFALRCSANNPAAIGAARNEAVELLERFGIEPRPRGMFFHDLAADERDARQALATLSKQGRVEG